MKNQHLQSATENETETGAEKMISEQSTVGKEGVEVARGIEEEREHALAQPVEIRLLDELRRNFEVLVLKDEAVESTIAGWRGCVEEDVAGRHSRDRKTEWGGGVRELVLRGGWAGGGSNRLHDVGHFPPPVVRIEDLHSQTCLQDKDRCGEQMCSVNPFQMLVWEMFSMISTSVSMKTDRCKVGMSVPYGCAP